MGGLPHSLGDCEFRRWDVGEVGQHHGVDSAVQHHWSRCPGLRDDLPQDQQEELQGRQRPDQAHLADLGGVVAGLLFAYAVPGEQRPSRCARFTFRFVKDAVISGHASFCRSHFLPSSSWGLRMR